MRARIQTRLGRLLPHGPVDVLVQVALMWATYMAYRVVRGWIDDPQGAAAAFQNARAIIDIERSLGIFVEPHLQRLIGPTGIAADAASWIYLNAQVTVTLGAFAYLYLRHNHSFYFVRNMFIVSWLIALVGYALLPTAPPRFFPEWGFVDSVADFTGVQPDSLAATALFNPYAAVPSMHVAFAMMIGVPLAMLTRHRVVRRFWACYPVLVSLVIVVTGNHFIIDAVLGALTALAAASAAVWLARAHPAWGFRSELARA